MVEDAVTLVPGAALIVTAIAILFRRMILQFFKSRVWATSAQRTPGFTILLVVISWALVSRPLLGRGRHRRDRPVDPLSRFARGKAGRVGYRPRRAADPDRRHRPLADRIGGSPPAGLAAEGFDPGITIGSLIASRVPDRALWPILGLDPAPARRQAGFLAPPEQHADEYMNSGH